MKKPTVGKTEVISFDEFIDFITDNRGKEIKEQIRRTENKKSSGYLDTLSEKSS